MSVGQNVLVELSDIIEECHDFPEDSRGSPQPEFRSYKQRPRGRCFYLDEHQSVVPYTARKPTNMTLPKRAATRDHNCERDEVVNPGAQTTQYTAYELWFQCIAIHWRSRLIAGQRKSATQVPLFCSGSTSHSAYLILTTARKAVPSAPALGQQTGA